MPDNNRTKDDDTFLLIGKGIIAGGVLMIFGLLLYLGMRDVPEASPSGHPLQTVSLPSLQLTPPAASPPVNDEHKVDLGFLVGGTVAQMFFVERDRVRQGDLLAVLDKAPFEKELESAQARLRAALDAYNAPIHLSAESFIAIEMARARVEAAQYAYDSAQKEAEKRRVLVLPGQDDHAYNNAVQHEQDMKLALERRQRELAWQQNEAIYKSDRNIYNAEVQIARNHVARAEADLRRTEIRAPISGVVTSRNGAIGEAVASGVPVYTLSAPKTSASLAAVEGL